MGDAAAAVADVAKREEEQMKSGIPGLDWSYEEKNEFERKVRVRHRACVQDAINMTSIFRNKNYFVLHVD